MQKIWLGKYEVVEVKLSTVTIQLGKNIHISVSIQGVTPLIKAGDHLDLYTEVPIAIASKPPVQ